MKKILLILMIVNLSFIIYFGLLSNSNDIKKEDGTIAETLQIKMKNILIKTVNEGTGLNAKTSGLIIGGKTGSSHIVEKGRYVEKYNTSFIGFANDLKNNKYTIGVFVAQPKIVITPLKLLFQFLKKLLILCLKMDT